MFFVDLMLLGCCRTQLKFVASVTRTLSWDPATSEVKLAWHYLGTSGARVLSQVRWDIAFSLDFGGLLHSSFCRVLCDKSADKHLPIPSTQILNKYSMSHLRTKGDSGRANSQFIPSPLVYIFPANWSGHTPDRCWTMSVLTWILIGRRGNSLFLTSVYPQWYEAGTNHQRGILRSTLCHFILPLSPHFFF